MTMDWKALLGEKDSFSIEDIEAATKSLKLVDLSEGGYVAKEKFDKLEAASKQRLGDLTAKVDELEKVAKPDEGVTGQIEEMRKANAALVTRLDASEGKALSLEREKVVAAKVPHSPKLARLAQIEAERLVDDETDFDTALAKVLEDPDYAPPADDKGTPPSARVKSGDQTKGAPAETDGHLAGFERGMEAAKRDRGGTDTKE